MTVDTRITRIMGRAVPVAGDDIDTDRIMPARYLRCVTFEHIGQYTFQDERFTPEGKPKDHPFNDPRYKQAGILVVNKNFGCGSSREHAPQGILRWGIRAIIGESFAEIFAGNCAAIGLPAVTAAEADVRLLMDAVRKDPAQEVRIDLDNKQASYGSVRFSIDIKESARKMFLEGTWDSTATLLAASEKVREKARALPYMGWSAAAHS
jgi:3-isopropylmalate/(R)-2-methylmalate dehydratase small subunit